MQNLDQNIGFEKNVNFLLKIGKKSQKIVINTSTPGANDMILKNIFIKNSIRLLKYSIY
jgi:hypothetical protein